MNNLEQNYKPRPAMYVVQLAGKVSGMNYEHACALFKAYQIRLEAKGYTVINPCELVAEGENWNEAMRICLNKLTSKEVGYIFRLPNWRRSWGAIIESVVAKVCGVKLLEL